MKRGRSLELYFIDGRADGMLTAEVFNWTGHVLKIPRTQIKDGLERSESQRTGVYILLGERDGRPLAYIGEAENMRDRLRSNVNGKDWWEQAILVSTSSDALHKAHVKFLESRLVEIAKNVGSLELENNNIPPQSSLNEAAVANMESFLETLSIVLPAIRVDMFLDKSRPALQEISGPDIATSPVFMINNTKFEINATATFSSGEMIVNAGSIIRSDWVGKGSAESGYKKLRDQLLANGVVSFQGKTAMFTKDYSFTSPSAAAAVVLGRAANGRTEWKLRNSSMTYADWEQTQVASMEAEA